MPIRKILYIIPFLFLMLLFPINAGELKGTGSGTTEAEALAKARENLVSSMGISVTYTQVTSRSADGKGKNQTESYSSQSIQSASFDLLGAEEETVKKGKTYTATVTVPESSARLYASKLRELQADIERVFAAIERDRENASLQAYGLLSELAGDFEACRSVLQHLSPDSIEASLTASVSSAIADGLYSSSLEKSMNSDSMIIDDLKRQEELSIISESGKQLLREATERLEETRKRQEELARKRKDVLDDRLRSLSSSFEKNAMGIGSFRASSEGGDLEKLSALMAEAESRRRTYAAILGDLFTKLRELQDLRDEQVTESDAEIMNAPYEKIDYVDGEVSKEAEEWRVKKAQAEKRRIWREFSGAGTGLVERYMKELESAEKATLKVLDEIVDKNWTLSSSSPGFSFTVLRPDLEKGVILCSCSAVIADSLLEMEVAPDYRSITGKYQPSMSFVYDYEEYRSEMAAWYELLTEYPELFDIKIDVTIRADGSEYLFDIGSCSIRRRDTGKYIYRTEDSDETRAIKYSADVRVDDYSWIMSFSSIVDTERFVNEEGTEGRRLSYRPVVDEGYKEPRKNNFRNNLILESGFAPFLSLNGNGNGIRMEASFMLFAGSNVITGVTAATEFLSIPGADKLDLAAPIFLHLGYYYPLRPKSGFYFIASGGPCIVSIPTGEVRMEAGEEKREFTSETTFACALEAGFMFRTEIEENALSHRMGLFAYANMKHGLNVGFAYRLGIPCSMY